MKSNICKRLITLLGSAFLLGGISIQTLANDDANHGSPITVQITLVNHTHYNAIINRTSVNTHHLHSSPSMVGVDKPGVSLIPMHSISPPYKVTYRPYKGVGGFPTILHLFIHDDHKRHVLKCHLKINLSGHLVEYSNKAECPQVIISKS